MEISVNDVCNLFVFRGQGCIVPCIDMKVYGVEQDFRMLMCTKLGEKRPLLQRTLLCNKLEIDTSRGNS